MTNETMSNEEAIEKASLIRLKLNEAAELLNELSSKGFVVEVGFDKQDVYGFGVAERFLYLPKIAMCRKLID